MKDITVKFTISDEQHRVLLATARKLSSICTKDIAAEELFQRIIAKDSNYTVGDQLQSFSGMLDTAVEVFRILRGESNG